MKGQRLSHRMAIFFYLFLGGGASHTDLFTKERTSTLFPVLSIGIKQSGSLWEGRDIDHVRHPAIGTE